MKALKASSALKKPGGLKASGALKKSAAAKALRGLAKDLFSVHKSQPARYSKCILVKGEIHHVTLDAVEAGCRQTNGVEAGRLETRVTEWIGKHGKDLGVSKTPQGGKQVIEINGRTKKGRKLLQIFHDEAGNYQQNPTTTRW